MQKNSIRYVNSYERAEPILMGSALTCLMTKGAKNVEENYTRSQRWNANCMPDQLVTEKEFCMRLMKKPGLYDIMSASEKNMFTCSARGEISE